MDAIDELDEIIQNVRKGTETERPIPSKADKNNSENVPKKDINSLDLNSVFSSIENMFNKVKVTEMSEKDLTDAILDSFEWNNPEDKEIVKGFASEKDPEKRSNLFYSYLNKHLPYLSTCPSKSNVTEKVPEKIPTCKMPYTMQEKQHKTRDIPMNVTPLVERYLRNKQESEYLENEIKNLNIQDRKRFWASYHGINTDINNKLDSVFFLVSDIEERLEDMFKEVQILRKKIDHE